MITLITGVPGAGKTLYCVSEILSKLDADNKKLISQGKDPRPVIVDNIPELKLDHQVAPDLLTWPDWAHEGALIVSDEVQRHWRPTPAGQQPHRSIAELETHRHRGLDFIILTQHPNLINTNVRRLVGRHIHIRRTVMGTYAYEWPECVTPDSSYRSALTKVKWTHPKKAFGLYKSASIHQKVEFRIPRAFYFLGASVVGVVFLGWQIFSGIYDQMTPDSGASTQSTSPVGAVPPVRQAKRPVFELPYNATDIYLSGVSGHRNGGQFRGVVVFELRINGKTAWVTNGDLAVQGYRVACPSDTIAQITDPSGHQRLVGYAPRFEDTSEISETKQQERGRSGDAT